MATFHGQTVDIYEDFEDALSGDWTETDSDTNIDANNAGAAKEGSYGALINFNGATDGGENSFIGVDLGDSYNPLSYGFWLQVEATDTNYAVELSAHCQAPTSMGTYNCKLYLERVTGPTYNLKLRVSAGYATPIPITTGAWYWVTVLSAQNTTCTLNVYNASGELVASEGGTGYNNTGMDSLVVGAAASAANLDVDLYIDELVIDYTDATFPLLGWDTGSSVSVPVIMHYMEQMRG